MLTKANAAKPGQPGQSTNPQQPKPTTPGQNPVKSPGGVPGTAPRPQK